MQRVIKYMTNAPRASIVCWVALLFSLAQSPLEVYASVELASFQMAVVFQIGKDDCGDEIKTGKPPKHEVLKTHIAKSGAHAVESHVTLHAVGRRENV